MSRSHFGTVRQLPSGRFQARYVDPAGQRQSGPETFTTRRAAREWLDAVGVETRRGNWFDPRPSQATFAEWVEDYLRAATHLRASTLRQKTLVLRRRFVPALGPVRLADLTPLHVREVLGHMVVSLSPQTVRGEYAVLVAVLNAAVDDGLLPRSPAPRRPNLPPVRVSAKARASVEDLARLAERIDGRYSALVWTAGLLGLRWSEVAALRVSALDFLARPGAVHVVETSDGPWTKTASGTRTVPMPDELVQILAEHLAAAAPHTPDTRVFTAPSGGDLRYNDFRERQWLPATRDAGLEGLTFHGLRHSAAGNWRAMGIHTQVIAKWLGHADDRVTSKVYGWVPDETERAGVAAVEAALASRTRRHGGDALASQR